MLHEFVKVKILSKFSLRDLAKFMNPLAKWLEKDNVKNFIKDKDFMKIYLDESLEDKDKGDNFYDFSSTRGQSSDQGGQGNLGKIIDEYIQNSYVKKGNERVKGRLLLSQISDEKILRKYVDNKDFDIDYRCAGLAGLSEEEVREKFPHFMAEYVAMPMGPMKNIVAADLARASTKLAGREMFQYYDAIANVLAPSKRSGEVSIPEGLSVDGYSRGIAALSKVLRELPPEAQKERSEPLERAYFHMPASESRRILAGNVIKWMAQRKVNVSSKNFDRFMQDYSVMPENERRSVLYPCAAFLSSLSSEEINLEHYKALEKTYVGIEASGERSAIGLNLLCVRGKKIFYEAPSDIYDRFLHDYLPARSAGAASALAFMLWKLPPEEAIKERYDPLKEFYLTPEKFPIQVPGVEQPGSLGPFKRMLASALTFAAARARSLDIGKECYDHLVEDVIENLPSELSNICGKLPPEDISIGRFNRLKEAYLKAKGTVRSGLASGLMQMAGRSQDVKLTRELYDCLAADLNYEKDEHIRNSAMALRKLSPEYLSARYDTLASKLPEPSSDKKSNLLAGPLSKVLRELPAEEGNEARFERLEQCYLHLDPSQLAGEDLATYRDLGMNLGMALVKFAGITVTKERYEHFAPQISDEFLDVLRGRSGQRILRSSSAGAKRKADSPSGPSKKGAREGRGAW